MIDSPTFTPQQVRAFQQLLLEARRNRGLTQMQAANRIGVSQSLISNLERGPQPGMRVGDLFKVLAYYHIEPNAVAEALGYWQEDAIVRDDPRFVAVLEGLAALPDTLYDHLMTSIELMLRGAAER